MAKPHRHLCFSLQGVDPIRARLVNSNQRWILQLELLADANFNDVLGDETRATGCVVLRQFPSLAGWSRPLPGDDLDPL